MAQRAVFEPKANEAICPLISHYDVLKGEAITKKSFHGRKIAKKVAS